ncbi:MAG: hypothetical protein K5753_03690 [Clostridia bacterium]|nr:hypothetical protein [Clostridia bacterium]
MKIVSNQFWVYYVNMEERNKLDTHKTGKWMYFFNDVKFASKICSSAVENKIVVEAKHSNSTNGVCCFYLNCDDDFVHRKTISFFLDNNLIKRTKDGKLYNLSFKLDDQTRAGQYGDDFKSDIKLSNYINLETGEFIQRE